MRKPTASRYPPATTEEVRKLFFLLLLLLSNKPEKRHWAVEKLFQDLMDLRIKERQIAIPPKAPTQEMLCTLNLRVNQGCSNSASQRPLLEIARIL